MKSLKPFLFVLVGVLITVAIFSFKSEEPKKEYATITFRGGMSPKMYVKMANDTREQEPVAMARNLEIDFTNKINELSANGWIVVTSVQYMEGYTSIILERTKQ